MADLGKLFSGMKARGSGAQSRGPEHSPASERALKVLEERLAKLERLAGAFDAERVYGPLTAEEAEGRAEIGRAIRETRMGAEHYRAVLWNRDVEAKRLALAEESIPDPLPTLKDAEREGRVIEGREQRRRMYLARVPVQQYIGKGPEGDTRPRCRSCKRPGVRLTPTLTRLPSGEDVRLCYGCAAQVEYDRERRCVSCCEPVKEWLPGHVCAECFAKGTERAVNLRTLKDLGWLMNPGRVRP